MTHIFKRRLFLTSCTLKKIKKFMISLTIIASLVESFIIMTMNPMNPVKPSIYLNLTEMPDFNQINIFNITSLQKIDWHDYKRIELDKKRVGIGEQGKPGCKAHDEYQREYIYRVSTFNVELSAKIALNRSLPDVRHQDCKMRVYLKSLPPVSVVVILHNEHWSTLLRTVYSVLNRSPQRLIKEIILVDDASTISTDVFLNELNPALLANAFFNNATDNFGKGDLEMILQNIKTKIKILQVPRRKGLVIARLAGAKAATADVLVFLDSHVEANVNWLPPLLGNEPVALDYRTVVVPLIDSISYDTMEYSLTDEGMRGGFDWSFYNRRFDLLPKDKENFPEPYKTPIMLGGLFAISRRFFWELGGYDPGLEIWGGEQFELSFKIWQCGGQLLEAPCSRVGHLFRKVKHPIDVPGFNNYLHTNYKRVAEVWMDEYAQYLYARIPDVKYADPGDLTAQKALRQKLKCKPFKWFMTQIAFDIIQQYPLEEPLPYASGWIRPHISQDWCVDSNQAREYDLLRLQKCYFAPEIIFTPYNRQNFVFTWFNDVSLQSHPFLCWDPLNLNPGSGNVVVLNLCHHNGGNQIWKYEPDTKKIMHYSNLCLDHNSGEIGIFLNTCDFRSDTQLWDIEFVNKEQLAKWDFSHLNRITGPNEEWTDDGINSTSIP